METWNRKDNTQKSKLEIRIRFKNNFPTKNPRNRQRNTIQHQTSPQTTRTTGKHIQEQIQFAYDPEKNTTGNWAQTRQNIHKMIQEIFHAATQKNARRIWDNRGYEHATEEEAEKQTTLG